MSKKMKWGFAILMILLLAGVSYLAIWQYTELQQYKQEAAKEDKLLEQMPEVVDGDLDTSHPDFHIHEDGTPHIGTHEDEPKVENTAPEGAVTTPDFSKVEPDDDPVKAAYKRLEYIKNNPYAWGGVHSERATELIAILMPPPQEFDHGEGEVLLDLMYELSWEGDPRAAEVLIANACDGYIGTWSDELVEIGPPAVPYILPYLEREDTKGSDRIFIDSAVTDSLSRIGARYRDDLGGIVDHIIIPKLKEIAADEADRYDVYSRVKVDEALERLQ